MTKTRENIAKMRFMAAVEDGTFEEGWEAASTLQDKRASWLASVSRHHIARTWWCPCLLLLGSRRPRRSHNAGIWPSSQAVAGSSWQSDVFLRFNSVLRQMLSFHQCRGKKLTRLAVRDARGEKAVRLADRDGRSQS